LKPQPKADIQENMERPFNRFPAVLTFVAILAIVADSRLASGQTSESQASEQQVKESIERVAKSVVCFDDPLLDAVGINRERCEFGIALYSDDCWKVLDEWVSDYGLADTIEDKEKYERITDLYIICQESKFLKFWVANPSTEDPE
jgi:hypothetical protein